MGLEHFALIDSDLIPTARNLFAHPEQQASFKFIEAEGKVTGVEIQAAQMNDLYRKIG